LISEIFNNNDVDFSAKPGTNSGQLKYDKIGDESFINSQYLLTRFQDCL